MRNAFLAEWGKAWTLRSPVLCLAAVVPVAAAVAFALGNDAARAQVGAAATAGASATITPLGPASSATQVAILVLAAAAMLLVTGEYQGGTISTTLLAHPSRPSLVLAKAAVSAVLGGLAGLAAAAAAYAAAAFGLSEAVAVDDLVPFAARAAAVSGIVGVLVVGLGFVLRTSVGTLTSAVIVLLAGLALPDATRPWTAASGMASFIQSDDSAYPSGVGLCVVAAWGLAAVGAGVAVFGRRDA